MNKLKEAIQKANESSVLPDSGDPRKAWEVAKREIEKSLSTIQPSWKQIIKGFEHQLKKQPTSWAGLGRGSDTAMLMADVKELADTLSSIAASATRKLKTI